MGNTIYTKIILFKFIYLNHIVIININTKNKKINYMKWFFFNNVLFIKPVF